MKTTPNPKPAKRIVDRHIFVVFHDRNPACVACTNGPGLPVEAHHIISRGQGGDDVLANLVGLCRSCHRAFHNGNQAPKRSLARWLRTADAAADTVEYLNWKLGPFGAEHVASRLER